MVFREMLPESNVPMLRLSATDPALIRLTSNTMDVDSSSIGAMLPSTVKCVSLSTEELSALTSDKVSVAAPSLRKSSLDSTSTVELLLP